jgi:esterase/lipase superfamily enzyme
MDASVATYAPDRLAKLLCEKVAANPTIGPRADELSQSIWGGVPRLGEIHPAQEPHQSELKRENIEGFDLTA